MFFVSVLLASISLACCNESTRWQTTEKFCQDRIFKLWQDLAITLFLVSSFINGPSSFFTENANPFFFSLFCYSQFVGMNRQKIAPNKIKEIPVKTDVC